jgi:UDP-N-acetylglucosamine 2-epimerase (non-hydrolysing)
MAHFDAYLEENPADVVIVVDDLASTMAAAIVTKKRGIKLAHLVAGTRSFDIQMPKEINRLVIDALSDYLFTAGMKSNSVATREQNELSQTFMVGNILMDTLRFNQSRLKRPSLDVNEGEYFVFTLNRKALIADEENLKNVLDAITSQVGSMPIIAPLRGKAREVVARLSPGIHIIDPLTYLEFGWLTAHSKAIITDSGNVAEEATFNMVPCITLNDYTEHQETVTIGTNVLVGGNPDKLREVLQCLQEGRFKKGALPERWDGRTAERIVQILSNE